MRELNKKQEAFYSKWRVRRKNKWKYAFINGSVYWGVPVALLSLLLNGNFNVEDLQISRIIITLILYGIGGFVLGLWLFRNIDAAYKNIDNSNEIKEGISILRQGQVWNYENLRISQNTENIITVRNDLLWSENTTNSDEKNNVFIDEIIHDFKRLQQNNEFNEFTKGKELKVQLFGNEDDEKMLVERVCPFRKESN